MWSEVSKFIKEQRDHECVVTMVYIVGTSCVMRMCEVELSNGNWDGPQLYEIPVFVTAIRTTSRITYFTLLSGIIVR